MHKTGSMELDARANPKTLSNYNRINKGAVHISFSGFNSDVSFRANESKSSPLKDVIVI